jgi:tRNA-specific 2-thiouridylase
MKQRALVAMSGGVDSSVAAAIMLEQGFDCIGVTLKLFRGESRCCSLRDVNDARAVAGRLGMPHYVLNFVEDFDREVIRRFIETYEKGATPNPCIDCNRYIKFNSLLLRARQLDFDYIVTGHYARISRDGASGRFLLKKSADEKKDQSYVLYCLTQEQLGRTLLPLGDLSKPQVRKMAEEKNFVTAEKKESQDICFVPDGDYGGFMEAYTGKRYPGGDIIDSEGRVLGRHRGVIRYTIGQRRGLGVAASHPVYVTAKAAAANTVTLGPESSLYGKSLVARGINLVACTEIREPLRVRVKTRYLQREEPATVLQTGSDELRIEFDRPQRALTPGQAAVMYDGDIVVGGGTITEAGEAAHGSVPEI